MRFEHKDLLDIASLSSQDITMILDTAEGMKEINKRPVKKVPTLRGKTIVLFFQEPSTRTKLSFDIAAKRLSADVISISTGSSSIVKGETLIDTVKNLEAMSPDIIVMRHSSSGAAQLIAKRLSSSVVNAGDGLHAHPTQSLLDMMTVREKKGGLDGLKIAIIGDIAHSRVARSNINGFTKMGATVIVTAPGTMIPRGIETLGCHVAPDIESCVEGADVVMMLRIQKERQERILFPSEREYASLFGLTRERLALARKDAIVMHPGPMNRGVEIANIVADGKRSVILEQVTNGVALRMAVFYLVAGGKNMLTRIKGAKIVDPGNVDGLHRDIIIRDGYIEQLIDPDGVFEPEDDAEVEEIDATGMIAVPGLIDLHVHLREPGHEYKETIETGAKAAVRGGFTTICPMPNTSPVNDNSQVTAYIVNRAKELGLCRVLPVGAITQGLKGNTLAEYGDMKQKGMVAISDDGRPVADARVMRRAMEYAKGLGLVLISHAEDLSLARDGAMNEGITATRLGIKGIPNAAESIMVMRDIALAELTGARIHIAHVSCEESVDAIRHGKARGVKVTAETAPHYFTLTDEAVAQYDTHAKMNPPLRSEKDRQAIIAGLVDGTLDIIATDHAPHSPLEKEVEFDRAAFGIVGLETSLALSLGLVQEGKLTFSQLIEKMSKNPAAILGIDNDLKPGNPGDITLIDPEAYHTIDPDTFFSKGVNTPFVGFNVKGEAWMTLVQGRVVFQKET